MHFSLNVSAKAEKLHMLTLLSLPSTTEDAESHFTILEQKISAFAFDFKIRPVQLWLWQKRETTLNKQHHAEDIAKLNELLTLVKVCNEMIAKLSIKVRVRVLAKLAGLLMPMLSPLSDKCHANGQISYERVDYAAVAVIMRMLQMNRLCVKSEQDSINQLRPAIEDCLREALTKLVTTGMASSLDYGFDW
eukprot:scaffold171823_cov37-Prasinocladus_malaysianus.AAC.2